MRERLLDNTRLDANWETLDKLHHQGRRANRLADQLYRGRRLSLPAIGAGNRRARLQPEHRRHRAGDGAVGAGGLGAGAADRAAGRGRLRRRRAHRRRQARRRHPQRQRRRTRRAARVHGHDARQHQGDDGARGGAAPHRAGAPRRRAGKLAGRRRGRRQRRLHRAGQPAGGRLPRRLARSAEDRARRLPICTRPSRTRSAPAACLSWRDGDPQATGEVLLADGRWLRISHSATRDQGFIVVCSDITLSKQQEASLRQTNWRLDAALDNMSQGLCLFDAQQRLEVVNRRFFEIFGLPREQDSAGLDVPRNSRIEGGDSKSRRQDSRGIARRAHRRASPPCQRARISMS